MTPTVHALADLLNEVILHPSSPENNEIIDTVVLQFDGTARVALTGSMHMKQSAGTLLYRQGISGWEILLVHPSGAYNRRSPWGIPKGEPNPDDINLEMTARRETLEETGVIAGELVTIGFIDYSKTRKRVHCFAGPAPPDAVPRIASVEVDQVRFAPLEEARKLLHPDQVVFIDRLLALFESSGHLEK